MHKRAINYLSALLLIIVFIWMFITGSIQLTFELHRFIFHRYAAYLLIILSAIHVLMNFKTIISLIKNKIRFTFSYGISIVLIFLVVFTFAAGYIQVQLNIPRSHFMYHVYGAYGTCILALLHLCLNLRKINVYLKSISPLIFLAPDTKTWKPVLKHIAFLGMGAVCISCIIIYIPMPQYRKGVHVPQKTEKPVQRENKMIKKLPVQKPVKPVLQRIDAAMANEYHQKTKHTMAELMKRTGRLNFSKKPIVFKEYPQAEKIQLSDNHDFDSISVEEAISLGSFRGKFSGDSMSQKELSLLLHHTNGITDVLQYPGLTYYLRAAPSAGALYPTVIYVIIRNVKGLKQGIYHYSVNNNLLYFIKEGDFTEEIAASVPEPSQIKKANIIIAMSTVFYRTKWKYRERGYRYVLLDTGHIAGNLNLMSNAMGLGSYSIGTFIDDSINRLLDIDGEKEAVVYLSAVGKITGSKARQEFLKVQITPKKSERILTGNFTIAEILHEKGKISSFKEIAYKKYRENKIISKQYPHAQKVSLPLDFSKKGISLGDAIRTRRSARDYSGNPISKNELSRLLYYTYAGIQDNSSQRTGWSIAELYPIELYVVINRVEEIAPGIYHYNVVEHLLELLKEGDFRLKIARACLGQELVGNANVAIIKTAVFERVKQYGNRGYRYVHLDAGAIGENIYLSAVSMGMGVCGIGAFFDDDIHELLGIDGKKEFVIYVTSVGSIQ